MSCLDRQGIPEEVLRIQLREKEIQESMKQKGDGVRDDEKDEVKDINDDAVSEANDDDMFEEAMDWLRSYSLVSIGGQTFETQGLVQLAMRKWLEMHGEEWRLKAQFNRKLNAVFPSGDHECCECDL